MLCSLLCVEQATQVTGTVLPIAKKASAVEFVKLTDVRHPSWIL